MWSRVPVTHLWASSPSLGVPMAPEYMPEEISSSLGWEGTLPQGLSPASPSCLVTTCTDPWALAALPPTAPAAARQSRQLLGARPSWCALGGLGWPPGTLGVWEQEKAVHS